MVRGEPKIGISRRSVQRSGLNGQTSQLGLLRRARRQHAASASVSWAGADDSLARQALARQSCGRRGGRFIGPAAMLALQSPPRRRRSATPRLKGSSFGPKRPLPYVASKRFDEPWCPQSRPDTPLGYAQSRPRTPAVSLRLEEDDEGSSGSPEPARKPMPDDATPALARAPTAPQLRQQLLNAASDRPATALPSLQRSQSVYDVARAAMAAAAPEGVKYATSLELATRPTPTRPMGLRTAALGLGPTRLAPPLPAGPKGVPAVASVVAAVVPEGGADKKRRSSELLSALSSQASSKRLVARTVGGVAASAGWEARGVERAAKRREAMRQANAAGGSSSPGHSRPVSRSPGHSRPASRSPGHSRPASRKAALRPEATGGSPVAKQPKPQVNRNLSLAKLLDEVT